MNRKGVARLQDIPNVGVAIEKDFILLGLKEPGQLIGRDPYKMYSDLCDIAGKQHDPCVIDVFISAVNYMEGGEPKKWWEFTADRKRKLNTH